MGSTATLAKELRKQDTSSVRVPRNEREQYPRMRPQLEMQRRRNEVHLNDPPRPLAHQLDPASRVPQPQIHLQLLLPRSQTRHKLRTLRLARWQSLTVPSARADVPSQDIEGDSAKRGESSESHERVVPHGGDGSAVCPVAGGIRIAPFCTQLGSRLIAPPQIPVDRFIVDWRNRDVVVFEDCEGRST